MLHLVKRRLCIDLFDKEAVVCRRRGDHKGVDALKFGVKFQSALYRLPLVGMALVEEHTHENVILAYSGIVLRGWIVDRGCRIAEATTLLLLPSGIAVRRKHLELCLLCLVGLAVCLY